MVDHQLEMFWRADDAFLETARYLHSRGAAGARHPEYRALPLSMTERGGAARGRPRHGGALAVLRPEHQSAGAAFVAGVATASPAWQPGFVTLKVAGPGPLTTQLRHGVALAARLLGDAPHATAGAVVDGTVDDAYRSPRSCAAPPAPSPPSPRAPTPPAPSASSVSPLAAASSSRRTTSAAPRSP
ncbi:MAG: hypothetical protein FJZ92_12195 [Chloroflexi bacterium]|nr:hypothetical protein [Chloroflexota bacterium]